MAWDGVRERCGWGEHRGAENGVLAGQPRGCGRQGSDLRSQDSKGLTEDTRDKREKPSPGEWSWRLCQNLKKGPLLEKWAVLPAGDVWQLAATTGWEGCYRHLAGGGQGCCIAQARVQKHTIIQHQMSMVSRLRSPILENHAEKEQSETSYILIIFLKNLWMMLLHVPGNMAITGLQSTQLVKSDIIYFHKALTLNWLNILYLSMSEHKYCSAESGKPPIWTAVIPEMLLNRLNISTCSTDSQTKVTDAPSNT